MNLKGNGMSDWTKSFHISLNSEGDQINIQLQLQVFAHIFFYLTDLLKLEYAVLEDQGLLE